ncbi:hypothetical protein [Streptomyces longhuiensis]|uniref:hypothetical protein n=1 Tax=Streptomyces longhuiensis TaxID=2880933 RepID=UPI001D0B6407|nr:hypothetical protein [Streptomyces longhuiensis]UDM04505.1 hypothetical protein LGI35_42765 [Streptomyces longhuiensis]
MIEQYTVATRRIPVRQQQLGLQLAQNPTGLVARHVRRDVVGSRVLDAGRSGQPVTATATATATASATDDAEVAEVAEVGARPGGGAAAMASSPNADRGDPHHRDDDL